MKKPSRYNRLSSLEGFLSSITYLALVAMAGVAIYYGVSAYSYQSTQDAFALQLERSIVDNATLLETNLVGNISLVNSEIDTIQDILNMTAGSGASINSRVTALEQESVRTINTVPPNPSTGRLDLVGGLGTDVTDTPGSNLVTVSNDGVVTVNGVPAGQLTPGQLELLSTGMITIVNNATTSRITIDGTMIVNDLVALQNEDSMQAMQIADLQGNVTDLDMRFNSLEMTGQMLADMLNGTTIEFNMTIMELIDQAMMNKAEIDQLKLDVISLQQSVTPPGGMIPWTGTDMNVPTGWLLCDGTQYDMTTYNDLFNVIGTTYCPGACAAMNLFAVPDMRGHIPVGRATAGAFNVAVGNSVGVETVSLTVNEMPSHDHGSNTGSTSISHTHNIAQRTGSVLVESHGAGLNQFGNCPNQGFCDRIGVGSVTGCPTLACNVRFSADVNIPSTTSAAGDAMHSHSITAQGNGAAFTNVQPSRVMHYIIKT